jgi:hypothetical protein
MVPLQSISQKIQLIANEGESKALTIVHNDVSLLFDETSALFRKNDIFHILDQVAGSYQNKLYEQTPVHSGC